MQFTTSITPDGEIYVQAGMVIDLSAATTAYYSVGSGVASDNYTPDIVRRGDRYVQAFVGGTGTSMEMDGSVTGTLAPIGYFRQIKRYEWQDKYGNKIVFDPDTGDATLSDSNDEVATFSDVSATTAPVGTFTATTYGEDTYNGGSAFTLTSTYEGSPNAPAPVTLSTAYFGKLNNTYTHTGTWGEWESDYIEQESATVAPVGFFKIQIADSGDVTLSDPDDVVANGDGINALRPEGPMITTTYGSNTYFNGESPAIYVKAGLVIPIAGYVWIEIELSSGSLVGASGPFFGASLPANSSTLEVVPIAYSDGNGVLEQIHEGPIHWR
jgi:hypothetical protein